VADRWSDGLVESGFGSTRMARLVGWDQRVRAMVRVEAALAAAQARIGLLPRDAAAAVIAACERVIVDPDRLAQQSAPAGTPVIALLAQLREQAGAGSDHLHHGVTSQDIVDTATVLQLRDALDLLDGELLEAGDRLADLADRHRDTLAAGRTLGQHAVPVTVGLRAARWLGLVDRRIQQMRSVRERVLVVQLGGAAGTLGAFGANGVGLMAAVADELDLAVPDLPWHAERDRILELAGALAGVAGGVLTIAGNLVLLAQTEVSEVRETAAADAGSSAMPHKHNPVHAIAARAAARLAQGELGVLLAPDVHEHERAAGAWQAEWIALPGSLVRTAGALERLIAALEGLEIDAPHALRNLASGHGAVASEALAMLLAIHLGRTRAEELTAELVRTAGADQRHLADVAAEDGRVTAVVPPDDVRAALAPEAWLHAVPELIDRALATHGAVAARDPT